MIARDALYEFLETIIADSEGTDALYSATSFRSLRGSVDETLRVVRVDVIDGVMAVSNQDLTKEMGVRFTVQFWVTPDGDALSQLDDAKDISFDMARQFFDELHNDQSLNGLVCLADADVFETGEASLGTVLRGVTYLDGEVNPLGQG